MTHFSRPYPEKRNKKSASLPISVSQQEADYARPMGVATPASGELLPSLRTVTMAVPMGTGLPSNIRILRLPEVIDRIGLKRASIYLYISRGLFPKPVSLGSRAVGWLESEVDHWLTTRVQSRHLPKQSIAFYTPLQSDAGLPGKTLS